MRFRNAELINWQIPQFDGANCQTVGDPDLFFHSGKERIAKEQIQAAKNVCFGCIHKQECLEFALENEIPYGVWGGVSEGERKRILRKVS